MELLTLERVRVLGRINRWGGWLKRDYSVLEHTVIGATAAVYIMGIDPRPFLLHDMEETEFGDITTPNKAIYTNTAYDLAVERWNERLSKETGVVLGGDAVKMLDAKMAHAESVAVASRGDPKYRGVIMDTMTLWMEAAIRSEDFADPDRAVGQFMDLWQNA